MKSLEHDHQVALFQWRDYALTQHPPLANMFAIPNGGKRDVRVAMKMRAEGVKAGVPDIFLAYPMGEQHGLFIELKIKPNRVSESQSEWLEALWLAGYAVAVCWSWEEARDLILMYLSGKVVQIDGVVRNYA